MKMKFLLISLAVAAVLIGSGCLGSDNGSELEGMSPADLVVIENPPHDMVYLGSPDVSAESIADSYVDVNGIVEAARGIYQNGDNLEVQLTVVEMEDRRSAENFVDEYKATYPELRNIDRFTEETINDQTVTRINKSTLTGGERVERFVYVWNNHNFVILVEGNTDDHTVLRDFSKSTGY